MSDIKQVIARLRVMADGFRHSYPMTAQDILALIADHARLEREVGRMREALTKFNRLEVLAMQDDLAALRAELERARVPVLWEIVGPDGVTDSMYDTKTQEMAHAVPGDTIRAYALVSTTEVKPR